MIKRLAISYFVTHTVCNPVLLFHQDFWNREPKFPALDWTNAKDLPSDATNSSHLLKVSSSLLAHAISGRGQNFVKYHQAHLHEI